MGLGWWQYEDETSAYTQRLLRQALSNRHLHSVRDQYTAGKLASMGFNNVVNTGCPTLWDLTETHCRAIPEGIASTTAVVTLTDYNKDPQRDLRMLTVVRRHYRRIVLWPQGVGDIAYLRDRLQITDLPLLSPRLESFDAFLSQERPDYVGTRLHGGIRALQKQCRAVIVSVDNRAAEMGRDWGLPVVDIADLEAGIAHRFNPPRIPGKDIERWKAQFAVADAIPPAKRRAPPPSLLGRIGAFAAALFRR